LAPLVEITGAGAVSKTTYRLPSTLRDSMRLAAKERYGIKGKSRWVREAIDELLQEDPALRSVGLAEDLMHHDALDVVNLGDELRERIEAAMTVLRRQDPLMKGVQSVIIRAAIRRRLKEVHSE
jgi:hypothetical protein